MAGPQPPNHAVGANGPSPYAESQPLQFPNESATGVPAFGPPTPVRAPTRKSRRGLIVGLLAAIAVAAAMTVAIVYGVRTNGANTGAAFSEGSAKTAIQGYLDALERRDTDTIVRNALCGMYDAVHDKRSDQALAKLGSDAFRKQFAQVELTSIDKIVYLSQYQAQALFTMQVSPASGGSKHGQVQGVAQLLFQHGQILVCSYVLRSGSAY
jgi:hypothetical protein